MQVKAVELVDRHQVDVLVDEVDRLIVAGHVEHHASPLESRAIGNLDAGDGPCDSLDLLLLINLGRQKLS